MLVAFCCGYGVRYGVRYADNCAVHGQRHVAFMGLHCAMCTVQCAVCTLRCDGTMEAALEAKVATEIEAEMVAAERLFRCVLASL